MGASCTLVDEQGVHFFIPFTDPTLAGGASSQASPNPTPSLTFSEWWDARLATGQYVAQVVFSFSASFIQAVLPSALQFNGRSETMAERPAFRRLLPSRRCLVLTNGFYEWRKEPKGKQPYYIHLSGDAPLVFAGLYDSWQEQGRDGPLWTFTILTTEASPSFQTLHDRMPVILPDEASRERWLDTRPESQGELQKVLGPYVQADLVWHKVTPKMGPVSFQGPECCLELQEESVKDGVKRLFSNWREQGAKEAKEGGSGKESVSGAGDERGEEGTRKKRRVKREQETEQEGGREEKGRGLEAGTAEAKAETAFELDPSPLAKPSSSELEQRTPAKQEPKQAKQTPPKRPAAKRHTPDPAQKSITQFFSP